jgi:hypothetical protein
MHSIPLADVTNIWLCTDGYADQFCGIQGTFYSKKYKYSRLKAKLTAIQQSSATQQRDELVKEFETWKGNMFQVDDVLLAGIRFY